MLYDVALRITQKYDNPVVSSRQLLRLMPLPLTGQQQVIAANLVVEPQPTDRADTMDFFGNKVVDVGFAGAHEKIEFRMNARVRREPTDRALPLSPDLAGLARELDHVRSLNPDVPHHYLPPSPRAPVVPEISAYARALMAERWNCSVLELVESIGQSINSDFVFDAEATTVETPVSEAFAAKRGVCQDFSHVMIVALRSIGIPAGYVSGFLRTVPPPGQERLQGADAMHAWVSAWCGAETGWIEYDPTNKAFAALDHIVIARGRDYCDVAPVKGVLRTSGIQDAGHSVDVIEVGNE